MKPPPPLPSPFPVPGRRLNRRTFLTLSALAGAGVAGAGLLGSRFQPSTPAGGLAPAGAGSPIPFGQEQTEPEPVGRRLPGAVEGRVLVIVDLQGGNDGLSTLVPYTSGRYRDLRPELAVPGEEVLAVDDEVGFHPSLHRLAARGLVAVEGVGPIDGNLSHFDMTARWERGDVDGSRSGRASGFLGRLLDVLDDGSTAVGVALGGGPSPHLRASRASALSLASLDQLWFLEPTDWVDAAVYQQWLPRLGGDLPPAALASASVGQLLDLAAALVANQNGDEDGDDDGDDEVDWTLPMLDQGGDLGRQLYQAADLLAAGVGTRVIYTAVGGYDTHSGHAWAQPANLAQLDVAVDGFLTRVEELGLADRVLVATISEFGRRVPENGSGLDHGVASTMLLAGPVAPALAGERPSLDDLDDDGNLRTAIGFDRYLATLAEEWLGVEAASVLDGAPEPLGLLV